MSAASRDDDEEPPIPVPFRQLSAPALRGLVEAFVLREGTDYGEREYSLEEKIAQVLHRLERGEAEVMFDPRTSSASIVLAPRPARGRRDAE
ncbi:MAG TPA: YheU family protein [Gammaproteobacteria bacterium]|nr:YheU family protein [Gammaproteobacteria bacterium]